MPKIITDWPAGEPGSVWLDPEEVEESLRLVREAKARGDDFPYALPVPRPVTSAEAAKELEDRERASTGSTSAASAK